jgi:hypothetical protein
MVRIEATPVDVGTVKVVIPLRASTLPLASFPAEGPAPVLRLRVSLPSGETVSADISGRSFRRVAAALRPQMEGGGDPIVTLQGVLASGNALFGAGLALPRRSAADGL